MQKQALSLDEQAARAAEAMLSKSGAAGDMPQGRRGEQSAEGGLAPEAGGKPIDEDAESEAVSKAAKTGEAMTSEPKGEGGEAKTGEDVTSEPKGEEAHGLSSEGDLKEDDDDALRQRKAGQVGVSGESVASGLPEDEDQMMRQRKDGKVGMSKSEEETVDADGLIKSLEILEQIAKGQEPEAGDPNARRLALADKLIKGELSKAESDELSSLLKVEETEVIEKAEESPSEDLEKACALHKKEDCKDCKEVAKSFSEDFASDPQLQEGYEVSSFLEVHSQKTADALDRVQNNLSKSLLDQQERVQAFNTQLAKSLLNMAKVTKTQEELIKSLTERLEQVENAPVGRKSAPTARALEKSLSGEVGGSRALTKNDVMQTLEDMALKGLDSTESGHPIVHSMALVEQGHQISKSLHDDIVKFRNNNGSAR